jgi:hypothetical protein
VGKVPTRSGRGWRGVRVLGARGTVVARRLPQAAWRIAASDELLDLTDEGIVSRVAPPEETVIRVHLVHTLDHAVEIDPLVEALPRPAMKSRMIAPVASQIAARSLRPSRKSLAWKIAKSRNVTLRDATVMGFLVICSI